MALLARLRQIGLIDVVNLRGAIGAARAAIAVANGLFAPSTVVISCFVDVGRLVRKYRRIARWLADPDALPVRRARNAGQARVLLPIG